MLTKCDEEFAEIYRRKGCRFCGATLHADNYRRKPRGPGIDSDLIRYSFRCSCKDCRKRQKPPSVRFMGPKVYLGPVIVLFSAMQRQLTPGEANALRERLKIDRRTPRRWRHWWTNDFIDTPFWKNARARFIPRIDQDALPLSLCQAFSIELTTSQTPDPESLTLLMKFLQPLYDP